MGWSPTWCGNLPATVEETCVILRDPVDRWISGIAQYLNGYILNVRSPESPRDLYDYTLYQKITADIFIEHYNMLVERIIFDQINRFDDHVWPQWELCNNICVGMKRRYIMMDENFDQNMIDYLGTEPLKDIYRNLGSANPDQYRLQEFLRSRLTQKPELHQRVIDAYADDYAFIERAKNEMV